MRALIAHSVMITMVGVTFGQSPSSATNDTLVKIQMPYSHLSDILKFYEQLSKRTVRLDSSVSPDQKISLDSHGIVSHAEALSLIREALRQQGIEVREVGDSEAFVPRVPNR